MDLQRIVVGTDFSKASEVAVKTALRLASESGARLYLLHVLELPTGVNPMIGLVKPSMTTAREKAMEQLEQVISDRVGPEFEIEKVVLVGPVAKSIGDFAWEKDADMIVVGTHGRQGLARVLLGSTAEALLRRVDCQVLAVRDPK